MLNMGSRQWLTIMLLGLCLVLGLAREALADEATEPFTGINDLAGIFTQVVRDEELQVVSRSEGSFAILKPHYLRWAIEAPGEQLILSDGTYLWQYDIDLETVTRQPVDVSANSPLRLLVEPETALADDYVVERQPNQMRLLPKSADALFEWVEVDFVRGTPVTMTVLDNLGQTITIELEVDPDIDLDPMDFRFSPPPGIDMTAFSTDSK